MTKELWRVNLEVMLGQFQAGAAKCPNLKCWLIGFPRDPSFSELYRRHIDEAHLEDEPYEEYWRRTSARAAELAAERRSGSGTPSTRSYSDGYAREFFAKGEVEFPMVRHEGDLHCLLLSRGDAPEVFVRLADRAGRFLLEVPGPVLAVCGIPRPERYSYGYHHDWVSCLFQLLDQLTEPDSPFFHCFESGPLWELLLWRKEVSFYGSRVVPHWRKKSGRMEGWPPLDEPYCYITGDVFGVSVWAIHRLLNATEDIKGSRKLVRGQQPAARKAYLSYQYAERKAEKVLKDEDAYKILQEEGIAGDQDDYAELIDYELPAFETWVRQLRAARNALGEQKRQPRAGRETGRSIAKGDQIEYQRDDGS